MVGKGPTRGRLRAFGSGVALGFPPKRASSAHSRFYENNCQEGKSRSDYRIPCRSRDVSLLFVLWTKPAHSTIRTRVCNLRRALQVPAVARTLPGRDIVRFRQGRVPPRNSALFRSCAILRNSDRLMLPLPFRGFANHNRHPSGSLDLLFGRRLSKQLEIRVRNGLVVAFGMFQKRHHRHCETSGDRRDRPFPGV